MSHRDDRDLKKRKSDHSPYDREKDKEKRARVAAKERKDDTKDTKKDSKRSISSIVSDIGWCQDTLSKLLYELKENKDGNYFAVGQFIQEGLSCKSSEKGEMKVDIYDYVRIHQQLDDYMYCVSSYSEADKTNGHVRHHFCWRWFGRFYDFSTETRFGVLSTTDPGGRFDKHPTSRRFLPTDLRDALFAVYYVFDRQGHRERRKEPIPYLALLSITKDWKEENLCYLPLLIALGGYRPLEDATPFRFLDRTLFGEDNSRYKL